VVWIARDGDEVVLRLSSAEAERLTFALRAGYETVSRAEYYIRHGLAQGEVRELFAAIRKVAHQEQDAVSARLEPGVEDEENPRRPRPST
jgi:hypothetical protein